MNNTKSTPGPAGNESIKVSGIDIHFTMQPMPAIVHRFARKPIAFALLAFSGNSFLKTNAQDNPMQSAVKPRPIAVASKKNAP